MPDRLFSEKEISALLKRAVEIQQVQGDEEAHGLSLAELRQIAVETGIDPRHVEAALAEMERQPPEPEGFHLLGGPMAVDLDRVVEGALSEAAWQEMVGEMEMVYGKTGTVARAGEIFEWTYADRAGFRVQLRATSHGDRTRLRVQSRFANLAAAIHAPIDSIGFVLALLIIAIGTNAAWLAPILSVLALVLSFAAARAGFGAYSKRQRRRAADTLARLERIAAVHTEADTLAGPQADTLPEAAPAAALLADMPEPEAAANPTRLRRRTR